MNWIGALILRIVGLGAWGPVIFIVAYIAAALSLAPAFLLTFAAGAGFWLVRGTILGYIGAGLRSAAGFGLASPLARSRLLNRIDRDPRVAAVRAALVGDAVWVMF